MFINCKHYVYIMKTLLMNTEERRTLLEHLLFHPSEKILIRKIAKKLKLNPGFVAQFAKQARKEGILKAGKVDLENPKTRAFKVLFNIGRLERIHPCFRTNKWIIGIGVYGSWSKGTNAEESDVDIWIKVKKHPEAVELARLRAYIRKKLGAEPSILVLTGSKTEELRKTNLPLYFSLVHSFHLGGEQL
jgi:predicted nucleotidyltransferase